MLADDQRKNSGVGATATPAPSGIDTTALRVEERVQLGELLARGRDQRARRAGAAASPCATPRSDRRR